MTNSVIILIAEDDDGHATLIRKNLQRAGLNNEFIRFNDGQEVLDFFLNKENDRFYIPGNSYLLLLDIRMPKKDGIEVLKELKNNSDLQRMPIIMVTTTDDPKEVAKCHDIGCNNYVTKPVDYELFINAIKQLGLFLKVIEVPQL